MLTDAQARRYARHILLPQVGGRGQERLLAARVAVDRVEPAAAVTLLYLAAAGVGTLVVRDQSPVAGLDGFLFEAADVGRPAVEAVRERIAALNPDVRVVATADDDVLVATHEAVDSPVAALAEGSREATRILKELVAW